MDGPFPDLPLSSHFSPEDVEERSFWYYRNGAINRGSFLMFMGWVAKHPNIPQYLRNETLNERCERYKIIFQFLTLLHYSIIHPGAFTPEEHSIFQEKYYTHLCENPENPLMADYRESAYLKCRLYFDRWQKTVTELQPTNELVYEPDTLEEWD